MENAMGLPSLEVRVLIEGDEIAVAAFFIVEDGSVECVAGVPDLEFAPHVARVVSLAASAFYSGDFKRVTGADPVELWEGITGFEAPPYDGATKPAQEGDAPSIDQFPF